MSTREETIEKFVWSLSGDRTLPLGHSALLKIIIDDYLNITEPPDRELLRDRSNRELYIELGKRAHRLVAPWSIEQRGVDPARPLVLFDMDGVLYDYNARVEQLLQEAFGYQITVDTAKAMYIEDCLVDPHEIEVAKSIQHAKGMFGSLALEGGALFAWSSIAEAGHNTQICSAPLRNNPWCIKEKRSSLARDFGCRVADEAIIDRDKFRHPGAVIIEDNSAPLHYDKATWRLVLFDRPYNQDVSGPRIFTWHDPNLLATLEHVIKRDSDAGSS